MCPAVEPFAAAGYLTTPYAPQQEPTPVPIGLLTVLLAIQLAGIGPDTEVCATAMKLQLVLEF